jgi:hypothetical protein
MESIFLTVVVPLALGLLTNLVYDLLRNAREYVKTNAKDLVGEYKIYWYNSKHIRDQSNENICVATVTIRRDVLYRLRVHFRQQDLKDGEYEGYEYVGFMKVFDSQLHWVMHGVKHNETYYAIFRRGLSKGIDALPGLFLLTANNPLQEPMAIRCVLCATTIPLEEVKRLLVSKEYQKSIYQLRHRKVVQQSIIELKAG